MLTNTRRNREMSQIGGCYKVLSKNQTRFRGNLYINIGAGVYSSNYTPLGRMALVRVSYRHTVLIMLTCSSHKLQSFVMVQ